MTFNPNYAARDWVLTSFRTGGTFFADQMRHSVRRSREVLQADSESEVGCRMALPEGCDRFRFPIAADS